MAFNPKLAKALSRIERLERTVEELALLPQRVARDVAPKLDALIKRQFAMGVDPYGRPWRPIKASTRKRRIAASRGAPPLTNTRKLRTGTGAKAARGGVRLVLGAPYGYFAQVGTGRGDKRPIFPSRGLPAPWRKVIRESVKAHFRRAVKR